MRPPAVTQSALVAPLNDILSTEASVRVLRVIAQSSVPLGKSQVARLADLTPSGARRTLAHLIDIGILEAVGAGQRQLVTLRTDHPLARSLVALFESEKRLRHDLIDRLRVVVADLRPSPEAAWIEGPVARKSDGPGDTLTLGVLASARHIDTIARELDARVIDIMADFNVMIEVKRWTVADLIVSDSPPGPDEIILLLGTPPDTFDQRHPNETTALREPARSHADLDRRTLAIAHVLARRIKEDPSLIAAALDSVETRMKRASARERNDLIEWRMLLDRLSPQQLGRFLTDRGERATRLRQSLPFFDVLSRAEWDALRTEVGDD